MQLQHFVITRFCILDMFKNVTGDTVPKRMQSRSLGQFSRRMKLLKMISGASVMGQVNQRFTWIILTDPGLPGSEKRHIENYFSQKNKMFIHRGASLDMFENTQWLEDYIDSEPDYLLTTSLDDDDMLSSNYVEEIQAAVNEQYCVGSLPPVKIFATSRYSEWNLNPSLLRPLGTSNEPEYKWKYPTSGKSVLVKYPALSITSEIVNHVHVERYLGLGQPEKENKDVDIIRSRIMKQLAECGLRDKIYFGPGLMEDLAPRGCSVVLSNHLDNFRNVERCRTKLKRVQSQKSFPGFTPDWMLIRAENKAFRRGLWRQLNGHSRRVMKGVLSMATRAKRKLGGK